MAVRQTLASKRTATLGIACETDVHHTTVERWEVNLRATAVAALWSFHTEMRRDISHVHTVGWNQLGTTLEMHTLRGDATNSSVWQKCKLHSTQVT